MYRVLGVSFLILATLSTAYGQRSGGGTSGSPTGGGTTGTPTFTRPAIPDQPVQLQVRITWPDNRTVADPVRVYLLTSMNSQVWDTFNKGDGLVIFPSVYPGRYRLKLEGDSIKEITTEIFDIDSRVRSTVQWVTVQPTTPATADATPKAGAMVSAVELNAPPKAKSDYEKGLEALGKGDLKNAGDRFQQAVQIYPKYGLAWSNLGLVRIRLKDEPGARAAWEKAIEVDDKLPSAYINLAALDIRDKKLEDASAKVDKALQADPRNGEGLTMQAQLQLISGHYDQAVTTARKVHEMPHQGLAQVHLIAGDALQHEGRIAEALAEYGLYLKEYPDSPRVAQVRAAMAQLQARVQNSQKNSTN